MCGICGGTICTNGVCNPSILSMIYHYAHYGFFVLVGLIAYWWDKIKVFFFKLFQTK